MTKSYDAIMIRWLGPINKVTCRSAFELSKKGYKTLSFDSNGDSGHGNHHQDLVQLLRVHYSYCLKKTANLPMKDIVYWTETIS